MKSLRIRNFGQLTDADVQFGDLTVFVGKQATGKTLFLEMLKLAVDAPYIHSQLAPHGLDWGGEQAAFLDIYLGEGMHSVLRDTSEIVVDGKLKPIESFARRRNSNTNRLMYIPAQRVLTVH